MTEQTVEAVANAICGCATREQHKRDVALIEAYVADRIAAHTKALVDGAGNQNVADRIVRHMNAIAMASQRADGTDIPLGEQCREAGRMIMDQAATIAALTARAEAAEAECLEQARLVGMGSERELALLAKIAAAREEGVRAAIEAAAKWLRQPAGEWPLATGHASSLADMILTALDPAAIAALKAEG